MAENSTLAFGRYLRTLRERRGLSLLEVSSLSQAFAETLNKGYLSRCENGHQRLALSKVVPLGRIYGVSADVLLERIELDMELDRVGGPETEGMTYGELRDAGRAALGKGFKWDAYAYLRDATALIPSLKGDDQKAVEQTAFAYQNCATVALVHGKTQFALHEYRYIENSGLLCSESFPSILERIATTLRNNGELDEARRYADLAVTKAQESGVKKHIAYAYSNRARQAYEDRDLELSASLLQKTYRCFTECELVNESARSLTNLAQVYFDLGRYRAARRALAACERIAPADGDRRRALTRILLGEIDALEDKRELAEKRWKEAAAIARKLNDKVLRFKAEYQLLKQACDKGNTPVARAIHRRLTKLSNYVPANTPELADFRRISVNSDPT